MRRSYICHLYKIIYYFNVTFIQVFVSLSNVQTSTSIVILGCQRELLSIVLIFDNSKDEVHFEVEIQN